MMMFQAKPLYFPDNTHPQVIADACLKAEWTWVNDPDKRVRTTNLCDKCGSCKYFKPMKDFGGSSCYGRCDKGRKLGQRSRPKCMAYERSEE